MDLAEYLALTDRILSLKTRDEVMDTVRRIDVADLAPTERRILARKLAAAAGAIDPALAVELLPDLLPRQ